MDEFITFGLLVLAVGLIINLIVIPLLFRRGGYWVAERWEDGELMARWTSRELSSTGPFNLIDILPELQEQGWKVYKVGNPTRTERPCPPS